MTIKQRTKVTVNGRLYEREVEPRLTLADFLRHELNLGGTHVGCEHGICGVCTVLINGQAVADFGYTRAAIVVHRGDLVEIEAGQGPPGNGQAATQLQVEVADTTPNVRAPRRGLRIQLSPGRTLLANIML